MIRGVDVMGLWIDGTPRSHVMLVVEGSGRGWSKPPALFAHPEYKNVWLIPLPRSRVKR